MTLIPRAHTLISRINTSGNRPYATIDAANFSLNHPCILCGASSFRSSPKAIQSNQPKQMLQQRSVGARGDGL
jgi:hypothetical protein